MNNQVLLYITLAASIIAMIIAAFAYYRASTTTLDDVMANSTDE